MWLAAVVHVGCACCCWLAVPSNSFLRLHWNSACQPSQHMLCYSAKIRLSSMNSHNNGYCLG